MPLRPDSPSKDRGITMSVISTPITEWFGIKHPIILAGMNMAAGPELAAAVTNAGGLGVIGGYGYTPKVLRQQIQAIKAALNDKDAPFGVDLLIPQVGGAARKTNYDYTKGQLDDLISVIISEKTSLFVSAVGVPPRSAVERLHAAGIPVMNMVGHPRHVAKALEAGVDIICAQAGEGGGHTGDVPASILIPACVDAVRGHRSSLTGGPVYVVGAGAVYDGRGLAANLMWGAQAVWVGTRFVASEEAAAPRRHKEEILSAGFDDSIKTVIYTGRPMRVRKSPYILDWEENRQAEIKELTSKGIIPHTRELEKHPEKSIEGWPWIMGRVAALIDEVLPAKVIVDRMVTEAAEVLWHGASLVKTSAKSKL
ncbi:putative nitronate monooxygenase [Lyophyllum shimeji]|uniref:Nitronate monooxygenase n=1 Tax=Lyophyllum shimeji TaxID=47721 RepID=A0A9P3PSM9_LYOSH|nr:putative nitronate monooxygenase [Lyophyllum shimeji]